MTALQTRQADLSVLRGQDFFRLFQELESGGDIYEINSGTKAICVGPQSDLANFQVYYLDEQAPDGVDEIVLAVNNPIIGRLNALLATQYAATDGLPGLIFIAPRDLVDNTFIPSTFRTGPFPQPQDFVAARPRPRIDAIFSFRDPPAVAPLRDDRQYWYPDVSASSNGDAYYILPYYGRRYGHVNFVNWDNSVPVTYTVTVLGINLSAGTQTAGGVNPGRPKAAETPIGTIVVVPGVTGDIFITADGDGMFDLLSVQVRASAGIFDPNTTMRVTVSDRVG